MRSAAGKILLQLVVDKYKLLVVNAKSLLYIKIINIIYELY